MDVLEAAHRIGIDVGMKKLADMTGMNYDILRAKLSLNNDRNHLYLKESVLLQSASGRKDILYAMAEELDSVVIPKPSIEQEDFPSALANTCAEFGDYIRQANETMSDGNVTPNEMKKLDKELTEMIAAATMLRSILEGEMKSKRPEGR